MNSMQYSNTITANEDVKGLISIAIIVALLTECSSQLIYDGVVYIVNPCPVRISITAKKTH